MITYLNDEDQVSEELKVNIKDTDRTQSIPSEADGKLDLSGLPLTVEVADIDQYPNEIYALLRKNGLGTSDSSALLGVNPYTSRAELIAEKSRNYLTDEERAVGDKVPVKKGRDLEPVIIDKFTPMIGAKIIKPTDLYGHKDYPYIRFNFDGVIENPASEFFYIPCEIKVVTTFGEKHYDRTKAWFSEKVGFGQPSEDVSKNNWSIETKAAHYGIPPYYYTQLQQQIMGLNAPFGYLTVLFEKSWEIYSFFVWRDQKAIDAITLEGYKVWEAILDRRGPNWKLNTPSVTPSTTLNVGEESQGEAGQHIVNA